MRPIPASVAATLTFLAAATPCAWLETLARQEAYRLCEGLGILSRGGRLWGQIAGMSVGLYEPVVHATVRGVGAALGQAPAFVAAMWAYTSARAWRGRPRPLRAAPLVAGVAIFGVAVALAAGPVGGAARDAAFRAGRAAGCSYVQSGAVFVTPDGPFVGGRLGMLFNLLWMYGPGAVVHLAGWFPAFATAAALDRSVGRARPGACPSCGYSREGLPTPACPECGAAPPA